MMALYTMQNSYVSTEYRWPLCIKTLILIIRCIKEHLNIRCSLGVDITKPCESLFASGRDV